MPEQSEPTPFSMRDPELRVGPSRDWDEAGRLEKGWVGDVNPSCLYAPALPDAQGESPLGL